MKLANNREKKRMIEFEEICRMSQKTLKKFVERRLKLTHKDVFVGDGFVYAQGKFPVLLVAHLDTVHSELPKTISITKIANAISSPQGIGGDDRCGVYMVLEVVKKFNCSVLFCEDEEVGAVGAQKFTKSETAEGLTWNYIIEFDRKGSKDAVFYDCANDDFEKFITKEFFKTAYGSFSDISVLAPHFGCAAVNLSCGYYEAHTKNEYVVFPEMEKSIEEALKILGRTTEKDVYEYIEDTTSLAYYVRYGDYSNYWEGAYHEIGREYYGDGYPEGFSEVELYYMIEYKDGNGKLKYSEEYGHSEDEAIGKFCCSHPDTPYRNIVTVYCDATEYYG